MKMQRGQYEYQKDFFLNFEILSVSLNSLRLTARIPSGCDYSLKERSKRVTKMMISSGEASYAEAKYQLIYIKSTFNLNSHLFFRLFFDVPAFKYFQLILAARIFIQAISNAQPAIVALSRYIFIKKCAIYLSSSPFLPQLETTLRDTGYALFLVERRSSESKNQRVNTIKT